MQRLGAAAGGHRRARRPAAVVAGHGRWRWSGVDRRRWAAAGRGPTWVGMGGRSRGRRPSGGDVRVSGGAATAVGGRARQSMAGGQRRPVGGSWARPGKAGVGDDGSSKCVRESERAGRAWE
jgi:hypothetical protein